MSFQFYYAQKQNHCNSRFFFKKKKKSLILWVFSSFYFVKKQYNDSDTLKSLIFYNSHGGAFLYLHAQSDETPPFVMTFESSRHPLHDEMVCVAKRNKVWLQPLFFLLVCLFSSIFMLPFKFSNWLVNLVYILIFIIYFILNHL